MPRGGGRTVRDRGKTNINSWCPCFEFDIEVQTQYSLIRFSFAKDFSNVAQFYRFLYVSFTKKVSEALI